MLLFALAVLGPFASAQRIAESLEVTVVEVPVTVRDRAGNAVRGLLKSNFQLLVDGKPVAVEYFDMVDLTKITAGQKAVPSAAWRNFVLLFDVANSSPGTIGRAQEAARTFIETQLEERDVAAVATFTLAEGAAMVTSFTRDKALLLEAVRTLGDAKYFKPADPLRLTVNYTERLGPIPMPSGRNSARADAQEAWREEMQGNELRSTINNDTERRGQVRTQLQNFGSVARALDRLHGQKQIILLSEGFDARLISGRDDLSFKSTQRENDAVLSGELWKVDSDQRLGSGTETEDLREMVELFRRSDVRLHAIDIKGLRTNVDASGGLSRTSNDSLFMLTRPTGGTVFHNDSDLSGQFERLLRQQEVIYVLGFKSQDPKPGQFHPVRVKLTGASGEIAHRSGYYDATRSMSEIEATLRFSQMLTTSPDVRDVPLSLALLAVPGDEDSARVPVMLDAAGVQLLEGIDGPALHANVFVYAFNDGGEAVDFLQQRIVLDVAKTGDAVRATGVRYVGGMRLPPGRYTIKALVRVDESGRMGLTTSVLQVPAFGEKAVLPPVAMGEMGRWVTVVSPLRGAEATDVLTLERPFVPLSSGTAGTPLEIALLLRGIPAENLKVAPLLVGSDGSTPAVTLELGGRTEPDEHGMSKLLFRLSSQTAAKGDYELRLTVTPEGSDPTTVRLPVVVR